MSNVNSSQLQATIVALRRAYPSATVGAIIPIAKALLDEEAITFDVDDTLRVANPVAVLRLAPRLVPAPEGNSDRAKCERAYRAERSRAELTEPVARPGGKLREALGAIPPLPAGATDAQKAARAIEVERTYRAFESEDPFFGGDAA